MKIEYIDIYEIQDKDGNTLSAYDSKDTAIEEFKFYECATKIVHTKADDSCRFYDISFNDEVVYTKEK